jgi:hypothetical protein
MNGAAAQKLLERMRASQSGWGQADFERLFTGFGFKARQGKHTIHMHSQFSDLVIGVPRHNSLKEWVARDAVKLIDELIERQNQSEAKSESRSKDD